MMASTCSPENLPGSDFSVYLSAGSLTLRPLRPSTAMSSAIAWRFCTPSFLKVRMAPAMHISGAISQWNLPRR